MKKKGHQRYISRMRGGGTLGDSSMKFGTLVELPDVMNPAKFRGYWLHGYCASWGQK